MVSGRTSTFNLEIAKKICDLLAEGYTLRQVCKEDGMPAASTVLKWAQDDVEGFFEQYTRARKIGYLVQADEILDISDDGSNDWYEKDGTQVANVEHLQRSKLRIDTRKWVLAKALPKIYGDRLHTVDETPRPTSITFVEGGGDE